VNKVVLRAKFHTAINLWKVVIQRCMKATLKCELFPTKAPTSHVWDNTADWAEFIYTMTRILG
jgi:hypothetical protein